jgi:hypothetical protein
MASRLLTTTVKGLEQLEGLGGQIAERRRRFMQRGATVLADDVREHAPRRTGQHLDPSIHGDVINDDTIRVGSFDFDGATALEDGATITAHDRPTATGRPSVLRFVGRDGEIVFRRRVVLKRNSPKRGFFRKRLRHRSSILDRLFGEEFDTL